MSPSPLWRKIMSITRNASIMVFASIPLGIFTMLDHKLEKHPAKIVLSIALLLAILPIGAFCYLTFANFYGKWKPEEQGFLFKCGRVIMPAMCLMLIAMHLITLFTFLI